jgi:putative transposase
LWTVRWYVAYPISYRQLEEMMGERGVAVDHSTLNRWVIKYAPEFEKQFRCRQRAVGKSWRLDETYVKIKGKWAYLYRAVLRSVPAKWRRARDEGLRLTRSLRTGIL